jgi:hypothetical protein
VPTRNSLAVGWRIDADDTTIDVDRGRIDADDTTIDVDRGRIDVDDTTIDVDEVPIDVDAARYVVSMRPLRGRYVFRLSRWPFTRRRIARSRRDVGRVSTSMEIHPRVQGRAPKSSRALSTS